MYNCFIEQLPYLKSYDRPKILQWKAYIGTPLPVAIHLPQILPISGNLPWKEVFTDAQLQTLIEQALTNNADLRSAALTVKQAQAALMSARLAYAPMLALSRKER